MSKTEKKPQPAQENSDSVRGCRDGNPLEMPPWWANSGVPCFCFTWKEGHSGFAVITDGGASGCQL